MDDTQSEGVADLLGEAIDHVDQGVVIVDREMRVRLANTKARKLWKLTEQQCSGRPLFAEFIYNIAAAGAYELKSEALADYVVHRFETVQAGDTTPIDIRLADGRTIRAQVTPLPSGGRLITHTDVTDLVERADRIGRDESVDALTGLLNVFGFRRLADDEWKRFKRYKTPFSVAVIDINRLKRINREFGHDVGDRAILHVSSVARRDTRSIDTVARIGAGRFAVLMPETSLDGAKKLADRLAWSIVHFPLYVGGIKVPLSIRASATEVQDEFADANAVVESIEAELVSPDDLARAHH